MIGGKYRQMTGPAAMHCEVCTGRPNMDKVCIWLSHGTHLARVAHQSEQIPRKQWLASRGYHKHGQASNFAMCGASTGANDEVGKSFERHQCMQYPVIERSVCPSDDIAHGATHILSHGFGDEAFPQKHSPRNQRSGKGSGD